MLGHKEVKARGGDEKAWSKSTRGFGLSFPVLVGFVVSLRQRVWGLVCGGSSLITLGPLLGSPVYGTQKGHPSYVENYHMCQPRNNEGVGASRVVVVREDPDAPGQLPALGRVLRGREDTSLARVDIRPVCGMLGPPLFAEQTLVGRTIRGPQIRELPQPQLQLCKPNCAGSRLIFQTLATGGVCHGPCVPGRNFAPAACA